MIIQQFNGKTYRLIPNPELGGMCDGWEEIQIDKNYTCAGCAFQEVCEYAFDDYCVDGECLADK